MKINEKPQIATESINSNKTHATDYQINKLIAENLEVIFSSYYIT